MSPNEDLFTPFRKWLQLASALSIRVFRFFLKGEVIKSVSGYFPGHTSRKNELLSDSSRKTVADRRNDFPGICRLSQSDMIAPVGQLTTKKTKA